MESEATEPQFRTFAELLTGPLARILRECGLSRGVHPDEFLDIQDFGRRIGIGIGRDQRNRIRDYMIRNGVGVPNGRSRAALGSEFIGAMRELAPEQHSERQKVA